MSWKPGVTMIVGSVPLDGPEEVFRACASALSPYLGAYPDGETGDRKYWTFSLAQLIYSKHPDLVAGQRSRGGRGQAARARGEQRGVEPLVVDVPAARRRRVAHVRSPALRAGGSGVVRDLRAAPRGGSRACRRAVPGLVARDRLGGDGVLRARGRVAGDLRRVPAGDPRRGRAHRRAGAARGPRHPVGHRERGARHPGRRPAAASLVAADVARGEMAASPRRHERALVRDPGGGRARLPLLLRDVGRLAEVGERRHLDPRPARERGRAPRRPARRLRPHAGHAGRGRRLLPAARGAFDRRHEAVPRDRAERRAGEVRAAREGGGALPLRLRDRVVLRLGTRGARGRARAARRPARSCEHFTQTPPLSFRR